MAAAERRARQVGTGADRVLIATGVIDEDIYARLMAASLGIPFENLDDVPRDVCPLEDERLMRAPAAGLLPIVAGDDLKLVVAPQGYVARRITELVRSRPELARRFCLTTSVGLQSFVSRHAGDAIGAQATGNLAAHWPDMSAGPPRWRPAIATVLAVCVSVILALLSAPLVVKFACDAFLTVMFVAWMVLRVVGVLLGRQRQSRRVDTPDDALPVYTILAPLYREGNSVGDLVAALRRLDYPPEKLDIKLIVEPDDWATRNALSGLQLDPPFEVIVAPDAGPRTKPKALNAALPFARGAFTVIYDAEDRPDPAQLRRALDCFLAEDNSLACVQASLIIDNSADNWLTAMFTAEYAGQFDVFLPALSQLRLPLPLGGSSNHFRTATLRAVGGWDPYNVTEDADLGVRLARLGHRATAIGCPTYEEAPAQIGLWMRQRTRWFKGWMQTWLVHMREPWRLRRELGLWPFMTVQLIVGGNVLASLIHPLMIVWLMATFIGETPFWTSYAAAAFFGTTIACGYFTSILLGAAGLFRRRALRYSPVLLLVPLHWLLLSYAAWRALYQLICDPYRWEKTEHGLARTSRVGASTAKPPPHNLAVRARRRQAPVQAAAVKPAHA